MCFFFLPPFDYSILWIICCNRFDEIIIFVSFYVLYTNPFWLVHLWSFLLLFQIFIWLSTLWLFISLISAFENVIGESERETNRERERENKRIRKEDWFGCCFSCVCLFSKFVFSFCCCCRLAPNEVVCDHWTHLCQSTHISYLEMSVGNGFVIKIYRKQSEIQSLPHKMNKKRKE